MSTEAPGVRTKLATVVIAAEEVAAAAEFLATVLGSPATGDGGPRRITLGETTIVVEPATAGERGVVGVGFETPPGSTPRPPTVLNGLTAWAEPAPGTGAAGAGGAGRGGGPEADVVLDHVAVVAADLGSAVAQWEAMTGVAAALIGLHPVSAGTLEAARLLLGEQMLEILAPVAGTTSAVGARLERVGEGVMALAVPARDLDAKRAQLEGLGVRLVWQDPHWLVHPANPAGVLLQLTPRVQH